MAKRNKIVIIALAAILVTGLAGSGIALAKNRAESGALAAVYAAPRTGPGENSEIGSQDNAMRRGGPKGAARGAIRGGPGMINRGADLARIATFLGMTADEVRTQLASGKSLAQIATEKGKTAKDLVTTILAPWKEHLQIDVKYGYISQAEADARYQLRAVRTEEMISRTRPAKPAGARFQMGPRGVPGGVSGGWQAGGSIQNTQ